MPARAAGSHWLLIAAATILTLFCAMTATAHAGTYNVYQCADPATGARYGIDRDAVSVHNERGDDGYLSNRCSDGGPLAGASSNAYHAGDTYIGVTVALPPTMPNTTMAYAHANLEVIPLVNGWTFAELYAGGTLINEPGPYHNVVAFWLAGGTRALTWRAYCTNSAPCQKDLGENDVARIWALRLMLQESVAPSLSASGILLDGSLQRGVRSVTVNATDADSGVQSIVAKLGSTTVGTVDYSSSCRYDLMQPCARTLEKTLNINTAAVPDGSHALTYIVTDAAGNVATVPGGTIRVDNVASPEAPQNVEVVGGEGWRATNSFTARWTNPASAYPIVRANWRVCPASNAFSPLCQSGSQTGAGIRELTGLTVPAAGEYSLWISLEDATGPASVDKMSDPVWLRFDASAPGSPRSPLSNGWLNAREADRLTLPITEPVVVPTSGIAGYAYTTDGSTPGSTVDVPAEQSSITLTNLTEGTHTIKVRAISRAGVPAEDVAQNVVRVDRTAPSVNVDAPSQESWNGHDVSFRAEAIDLEAGMLGSAPGASVQQGAYTELRIDDGAWQPARGASATAALTTDGEHTVQYRATDAAGNTSDPQIRRVRIDTSTPAATELTGTEDWLGDRQASSDERALDLAGAPPISGLAGFSVTTDGTTPDDTVDVRRDVWKAAAGLVDGVHTVKARAISGSGLAGPTASSVVRVDRTAPSIVNHGSPNESWQPEAVTITAVGDDAASGIQALEVKVDDQPWGRRAATRAEVNITADGEHMIRTRAVDVAGNVSEEQYQRVRVDASDPDTVRVASASGWLNADQAAGDKRALTIARKPVSGLAGYSVTTDGTTPDGTVEVAADGVWAQASSLPEGSNELAARAVSGSGRLSTVTTSELRIDRSAPTLKLNGVPPAGQWTRGAVTLDATGVDQLELSGMAAAAANTAVESGAYVELVVDGATERHRGDHGTLTIDRDGRHTFTAAAVDLAGNRSSERTAVVLVDRTAPTAGDLDVAADGTTVSAPVADATSGVQGVTIELRAIGETTSAVARSASSDAGWRRLATDLDAGIARANLLESAGLTDGQYQVRLRVRDAAGNETVKEAAKGTVLTFTHGPKPVVIEKPVSHPGIERTVERERVVAVERAGTPAGALVTGKSCKRRGLATCDVLLIASVRLNATGPALILRLDSKAPLTPTIFRLPKGLKPVGKRQVAVRTVGVDGKRRYVRYTKKGRKYLTRSKAAPALGVGAGSLRVRGLPAGKVGGLEITVPISNRDVRRLAGKKVSAQLGRRTITTRLARGAKGKTKKSSTSTNAKRRK
jgi:hypothetical protein